MDSDQLLIWIRGLNIELAFWAKFLRTQGANWPEDYRERLRKDRPLAEYVARLVHHPAKILDVGCGPLTILGGQHAMPVEISACDPLGGAYASLLTREHIDAPVRPVIAFAEDLSVFFPTNTFDIVHCRNALDHSFDPVRGIREMVEVTRVGGHVVLLHNRNEGEAENYYGLHQWNFDIQDNRFIIWSKVARHNIGEVLAPSCDVSVEYLDNYVLVYIRKNEALDVATREYKNERVRDLLVALSRVAIDISSETTYDHLKRKSSVFGQRVRLRLARMIPTRRGGEERR